MKSNFPVQRVLGLFFSPILLVMIQSCSNTPIGQELSNSFDSSIDANPSEESSLKKDSSISQKSSKRKVKESSSFSSKLTGQKLSETDSLAGKFQKQLKTKTKKRIPTFTPQPYRITIKLSAANPSAPAETVTKALRTAGVSFEVEMIERIEQDSLIKESSSMRSKR